MNKIVYVVTNPELGWDCVVGVYYNKEDADLADNNYIIHTVKIQ